MGKLAEFAEQLSDYLQKAEGARRRGAHHDHRRHLFAIFLHDAFRIGSDEVEIERGVRALKLRGRIDLLFRDLIFEFKSDLEAERDAAKAELTKYLSSSEVAAHSLGILTDGVVFEVYTSREGDLERAGSPVDLRSLAGETSEAALLWLDSLLFSQKNVTPTSEDVVRRFGASSAVFAAAFDALRDMFQQLRGDDATQTKFREWNSLLAKVYGSRDIGTHELFLRHTYLSVLAKVFAYLALFHRKPQSERTLTDLISGEAFGRRGFVNLAEEDFFCWLLHPDIRGQALRVLRGLTVHLAIYDVATVNEDLLKQLYQGLVDPETRHDLGEFYTPDWLAELTLREAGYEGEGSILDPACGSGTFLFTAVRLARVDGKHGRELVEYARENVMGVDVHPLAVTVARANYALALAPDLEGYQGSLPIPIYMADALLREAERQEGTPITIVVSSTERTVRSRRTGKGGKRRIEEVFLVPASMARQPALLDDVIDAMCRYARGTGDKQSLTDGFRAYVTRHAPPTDGSSLAMWQSNLELMVDLVRRGRDTIWGFILRNAYRPVFLSDRGFDLVAGNPPWLAYRYIQDSRYQSQVKNLSLAYGLLDRTDVHLFTVMDTSTLFFEFCCDRYVKQTGTLAFVMPRSVLTGAKQHSRFQQRAFSAILDLEKASPLFNVPACVLVARKETRRTAAVPLKAFHGELPGRNVTWAVAGPLMAVQTQTYTPLAERPRSHYWSAFREGASIVPRCLWFLRPSVGDSLGAVDPEQPYLETHPDVHNDAKAPWKGMQFEGQVEGKFLYATLLGRNLLPFGWREFNLIALPLLPARRGRANDILTAGAALSKGYPALSNWLQRGENEWESKKKATTSRTIYERLDYQHLLTSQRPRGCYKVLYNTSGTHLCSCVVDATRSLRAEGLPVNGFVAEMVTHFSEFDDPGEAHYVCAVLNSPFVDLSIKPHQSRGQWGERHVTRLPFQVLPIPPYSPATAPVRRWPV